jgi:hypothetical protein
MFHTSVIILINLIFIINYEMTMSQSIIKEPSDTFVKLGQDVKLYCHVMNYDKSIDRIEWCKNNFCSLGRLIELPNGNFKFNSIPRYYIIKEKDANDVYHWDLLIQNVTNKDMGEYKCKVERQQLKLGSNIKMKTNLVESYSASLRQMKRPTKPELSLLNRFQLIKDEVSTINCSVMEALPAPNFYWQLNGQILNGTNVSFSQITRRVHGLVKDYNVITHQSQLKLTGDLQLQNNTLQCIVYHPLIEKPLSTSIKINVKCKCI